MSVVKIVLVDDHHLVRAGLKALIDQIPGYSVAGEGRDGDQAVDLVRQLAPDVLIMDIAMGEVSGIDALKLIREFNNELPVIMLSMHAGREYILRAFQAGASGYLLKDSAEEELDMALRSVLDNQLYLSPRISRTVMTALVSGEAAEQPEARKTPLTARQEEILRLLASGKATKEIAWHLNLSTKTVESHRAQIMERLEIRDVPGLVRYAVKVGLISLDDG